MKIRRFGKIYMHKILIDRFREFQKSTQKWKFLTFLASLTYYKAFNGIIFIFLKYIRLLWARWCIFQKNSRQIFFDQNHCISPKHIVGSCIQPKPCQLYFSNIELNEKCHRYCNNELFKCVGYCDNDSSCISDCSREEISCIQGSIRAWLIMSCYTGFSG